MENDQNKYRLVTRSDMDGLVCAILLKEQKMISEITFVHPKDVQDGKIELTANDITTNLPYSEKVHLAFDHHISEDIRLKKHPDNYVNEAHAASVARVLYNYLGGKKTFPNISDDMMKAVDKADSAHYTMEDVLNPKGWELLSFLMDPRTGLGRFKEFSISNYNLMMKLIDYCLEHTINDILKLPDVKERVDLFMDQKDKHAEQIRRCTTIIKHLGVLDLRTEEIIFAGNRFVIYALYPEITVSMHVMWGMRKQNTVFAIGKSIFNRSSTINIGELMLQYGGGGHEAAGTCQVENNQAEEKKAELIRRLAF